jgi:CubicO group peptidase (beta-lactamase class C family)
VSALRARAFTAALAVAAAVAAVRCGQAPTAPAPAAPSPSVAASPATRLDLAAAWVESTPAELGLDATSLAAAAAEAATMPRFRSLLVARHGRLAFERYFGGANEATLFDVRSVTKSVVSALTGIALRDQILPGLDAPVAGFLSPPYVLDEASRGITVRHLLTMTSGFQWNEDNVAEYNLWIVAGDHVQYLLDRPHANPPGTQFTYNSAAVHTLGVVLQRAAGMPLPQYARDRLFAALGIDAVVWEPLDRGTVNGGSGIQLRGRDLLKLGQLYLQQGWSGERSLVPASWVDEATRPRFAWRNDYGAQKSVTYGMLWWVSDANPAAFFAWGYGGQFVYVAPGRDLVVVATTNWRALTETTPVALAEDVLGVIVRDVVPAAR